MDVSVLGVGSAVVVALLKLMYSWVNELREANRQQASEIKIIFQDLQTERTAHSQTRIKLNQFGSQIADLKQINAAKDIQNENLLAQVGDVYSQLSKLRAEFDKQVGDLQAGLQAQVAKNKELSSNLDLLANQNAQIRAERDQHKHDSAIKSLEIERTQKALDQTNQIVKQKEEHIQLMNDELKQKDSIINELRTQLEILNSKVDQLSADIRRLSIDVSDIKSKAPDTVPPIDTIE